MDMTDTSPIARSKVAHAAHEGAMTYWKGAFDPAHDDTKRHFELLESCLPIAAALRPSTIMTIGDNRGRDAAFFKMKLGCKVTATDLDISKLIPAKRDGFIDDCRIVDVERIDMPDDSVDLVVAKETFHHWPRPMLGFYEILRVARYGVILLEPYDFVHGDAKVPYPGPATFRDAYEPVGNYKYQISLREMLKAAWALYLDTVVVKGFNDPYKKGFTFDKWLEEKKELDRLGEEGKRQFNLMTVFVEKMSGRLGAGHLPGYKIYKRPANPHQEVADNTEAEIG